MASSAVWNIVSRGVSNRSTEQFKKLTLPLKEEHLDSNAKKSAVSNTRTGKPSSDQADAQSWREFYGINLLQIEGAALTKYKGAEAVLNQQPLHSLEELNAYLPDKLVRALTSEMEYIEPTAIQRGVLPLAFAGRSLVAIAPTGSGKTLAFALAAIHAVGAAADNERKKALVVSPTRELVYQTVQVFKELENYGEGRWSCGTTQDLNEEADIIVGTPGLAHMSKEAAASIFKKVRLIIFDEVDNLLGESSLKDCDFIVSKCKSGKQPPQMLMFSASFPESSAQLAGSLLLGAPVIQISSRLSAANSIKQQLVATHDEAGKLTALQDLICDHSEFVPPVLVFVQDVVRAVMLTRFLQANTSIPLAQLHGGIKPEDRIYNLNSFRAGKAWMMICTDLAARGIDFKGIRLVINFDLPLSAETYIHRIGRTGRTKYQGAAITFYTRSDVKLLRPVVDVMRNSGMELPKDLPENLPRAAKKTKRNPWRHSIVPVSKKLKP